MITNHQKLLKIIVFVLFFIILATILLQSQNYFSRMEESTKASQTKLDCWLNVSAGGRIEVLRENISMNQVEELLQDRKISNGGHWRPESCSSIHKIAIIVPFRNRDAQLPIFLRHMHNFLQNQKLEYAIYVVQQEDQLKFNRATLINIGFVESNKVYDWQCHFQHDVDLLPEDSRNYYSCPESNPRHMITENEKHSYRLIYDAYFGGVAVFTVSQFLRINGCSNKFFGWGGEDDDLWNRVVAKGYKPVRYPKEIGRYAALTHSEAQPAPDRFDNIRTGAARYETDGLNSLKYYLTKVEVNKLYTKFIIHIVENTT